MTKTHTQAIATGATASDASIVAHPLNLAAPVKDTRTSNLDSSSSNTDTEKTKAKNKDDENGNGRFERIRRPLPSDTNAIYDGDSDTDAESVFESDSEIDSMIPVGDKLKGKSKFQILLREIGFYIAPESDREEEPESESESESRPQSSSINYSTEIENQGSVTSNDNLDEIENQDQQDSEDPSSFQLTPLSTAEFVIKLDYQSMRHILAKTETYHCAASDDGTNAKHEVETASHAAAHLDSLEPMNSPVKQDDATRNASIRATTNGLQNSTITVCFHIFLAAVFLSILIFLGLLLPQNCRASLLGHPSMMTLLSTISLLLFWKMFVLFYIGIVGDVGFNDIRCFDAEKIPNVRSTSVLN